MSILRTAKVYQTQATSDASFVKTDSAQPVEQAHAAERLEQLLQQPHSQELNEKKISEDEQDDHLHASQTTSKETTSKGSALKDHAAASIPKKTTAIDHGHHDNHVDFHHEKSSVDETSSDDEIEKDDKKEMFPTQGIGMAISSGIPIARVEKSEALSDLLSAAMHSLTALSSSDASTEDAEESKLNILEESSGLAMPPVNAPSINNDQAASGFHSDGSLGSSESLGEALPKPVAAAVRTVRFTDFLQELTATVSQARLNSSSGQDITLQLRSDVLDATNVNINATATHMEVAFSTTSAASNALLNTHLMTLQNHLAVLCPGQAVEVKNQFLTSSSSSEFNNEQEKSRDDLADLNHENRGNWRDNDDNL